MNSEPLALRPHLLHRIAKGRVSRASALLLAALLTSAFAAHANQDPSASPSQTGPATPNQPATQTATQPQPAGTISGRIVDPTGVAVVGATIKLTGADPGSAQQTLSDPDGRFSFASAAPGPVHLAITAAGFAAHDFSANLAAGENLAVPQITLPVATLVTQVKVTPPTFEIAEEQIKEEEKQRALGFIPNYYVTYLADAAPLAPRQKFELAWKSMVDPVTFGIVGAVAGIQQAQNNFSGYGQGADGYAKRYGAAYADSAISTFIGGAILPSLWHQDPRYFYKGTGSKKSRLLYAISMSVVSKGDNGKWQPAYAGLVGGLAAAGISNAYYPAKDRDLNVTFENWAIGIGASAAANVLQEFVIKKLTPSANKNDPNNNNGGGANGGGAKALNSIARAFGKMVREGD